MIFARAALIAILLLGLTPAAADAAMALRITVDPTSPLAGRAARVTVLTLAPFSEYCVDDPRADVRPWWDWNGNGGKDLRFELKAFHADRVIDIPLSRRASDLAYWDGEAVFPAAGTWTVRMVHPEWSGGNPEGERCAGARITVVVRGATGLPDTSARDLGRTAPSLRGDERPPAAMCFDIAVDPDPAQVGRPAAVAVRSQWKTGITNVDLRVWRPGRASFERSPLVRVSQDEETWQGNLTFSSPGTWALQIGMAVESNEYPCFYRTIEVVQATTTESRDPADEPPLAAVLAVLVLGGIALGGLAITRRRRLQ